MRNKWGLVEVGQRYSINIWLLSDLNSKNIRVLYGCALPIDGEVPLNNWFKSNLAMEKKDNFIIEKLNCFISGKDTINFMNMLENGKTFNEISLNIGLNNLPEYLKNLLFSVKDYQYRNPVFLETRDSLMYYIEEFRPISTLAVNPCICESLVSIDKLKLLESDNEENKEKLINIIIDVMTQELPFEIPGPDSQRLGDFELFSFQYGNGFDIAPLEFSIIKSDKEDLSIYGVKINIKASAFKGKVYLRCRTRNGNVIIGDQVRLIENGNEEQDVVFNTLENCSEVEVSVWDAEVLDQPITLLYEYRVPIIRIIGVTTQLGNLQGKLETQWIKKISRKSGNQKANNEFKKVSRSYSTTGGFEKDPWVPASRKMSEFIKTIIPKKSNASFFEKGWQDENRFIKWLQEVVGKHKTYKVILIDPYFDVEAVSKFLGLSNYSDLVYEVITDIGLNENKGNEIREECIRLKAILPPMTEIYGLTRINGGTEQIFHDRFLIIFGESQIPIVYMLSNSISGVAKKFPSVAIPVPSDVGKELVKYYLQLRSGKGEYEVPEVNITNLWPFETPNKGSHKEEDSKEDKSGKFPGFQNLSKIIFENGVIPEEQLSNEGEFLLSLNSNIKVDQFEKIGEGISNLLNENPIKAIELWSGIANWSVRIMDKHRIEMFDWFNQSKFRSSFISVAEQFVFKSVELDYPLGLKNMECNAECISIAKQSTLPFEKMRRFASSMINHHYLRDYPVNYSVSMTFYYLNQYSPETAYEVLSSLIELVINMDQKKSTGYMMPYYKVISISLHDIALNLSNKSMKADFSQLYIGMKSNSAIIRAMYVISISKCLTNRGRLKKDVDIYEMVDKLNFLESPIERIYAYSWIAYDCQILRNRTKDYQVYSDLMDYIKKKFVSEVYLAKYDNKILRSLLKNFSGPMEGDHSKDIFEVLELLVEKNKIFQRNATDYIRKVLLEKMNDHMEGTKSIYTEADIPFTYNSIIFFVKISSEKIDELVNDIIKTSNKAKRRLMKPFARSKSYSEWKKSIEVLCWCGIAISQINIHIQLEKENVVNELSEIRNILLQHIEDFDDDLGLVKMFQNE